MYIHKFDTSMSTLDVCVCVRFETTEVLSQEKHHERISLSLTFIFHLISRINQSLNQSLTHKQSGTILHG